jgi:two-component sensor histidine kinase
MMLNELLRNALKHAFPAGRAGTVRVKLERRADSKVVLTVSDDGVGIDLDAPEGGSLGWRLVLAFAEQLEAEVSLDNTLGFSVSIAFSADGCNN